MAIVNVIVVVLG